MDERYNARYRDLYERHWWWRAREHMLLDVLGRIAHPGAERILDVGCGEGLFFDALGRFGVVEGVDAHAPVSATSEHRRIFRVPFDAKFQPGKRYSLVLMFDVLEHLDDPVGALRHAQSLLDHGGRIVITVPACPALWTSHDDFNEHRVRYTRRTLTDLAARAGMRLDGMRYLFHWTFPVKFAVRRMERWTGRASAMVSVPPGPINRVLRDLSLVEYETLGRLRVPFGSSLLAVATPAAPTS